MARLLRRLGFVLLWVLGVVAGLLAVLASVNALVTANERASFVAPGTLVKVGDAKLHILTLGSGSQRLVFLPGGGNVAPAVDFRPLLESLKSEFRVSVVEPLGYGWSDGTSQPRTLDAQLEQTRSALKQAGVEPPYVLIPHSISGLLTLYWVKQHPEEISGIVGLDTSVRETGDFYPEKLGPNLLGVLRDLGVVRLALYLSPGLVDSQTPALTPQGREEFRVLTNWNFSNDTTRNEVQQARANSRLIEGVTIPDSIPTTFLLSQENVDDSGVPGFNWKDAHLRELGESRSGKVVVVPGTHYFYRDHADEVLAQIRELARSLPH